jgi:hypothetical protein
MSDALRQLHAAANVLADSGLRTVKTNDLCIAVYGAIDEITRLREALKEIGRGYCICSRAEEARAALAETEPKE